MYLKGLEIPVVHAQEARTRLYRQRELVLIVDLDQRIEPKALGDMAQLGEAGGRGNCGDNQQDRIRPGEPCLIDLDRVDQEVLAQQG